MTDLGHRIEEAMRDYWFHPRLSWSEWPTAGEYIAARLEGRVAPPKHSAIASVDLLEEPQKP